MVKQFLAILMIVCAGLVAQAQPNCTPVVTLSGNITSSRTLDRDTVYLVDDCVHVTNNSTLTIESGTVIEFQNNSILMILKDGLIDAVGTPTAPIVMTANVATPGMGRGPVTNAGLVIVGDAEVNESPLNLTCSVVHTSGSNNTHSSGSLEYVQFHYLDGPSNPSYMTNALSLVGVGSGTTLEHIQITNSGGNGVGILGGHPVITNLYVENTAQNDIYVSFGAITTLTEVLTLHKDCDLKSTAGTNSVYIENNPFDAEATPEGLVTIDRSTFLGPLHCGCEPDEDFQDGIVLNNNAGLDLKNSVVSGFNRYGIYIGDLASVENTVTRRVQVNYTSFTNNGSNYDHDPLITWLSNGCDIDMEEWIEGTGSATCIQDGNQLITFDLDYNASICSDFCGEDPIAFTLGEDSEIDFIEDSETIRRGSIQPTDNFTYITLCPKDAVYCTPAPLFKASPSTLQIYPNPATQQAFVAFEAAQAGSAEIVVRELVTGRILYKGTSIISQQGQQQVAVPVRGWKEGVYPVQIKTPGQLFQGKISIQ